MLERMAQENQGELIIQYSFPYKLLTCVRVVANVNLRIPGDGVG